MKDILIDFQLFLNDKGLINNHNWNYEKQAKKFVRKYKPAKTYTKLHYLFAAKLGEVSLIDANHVCSLLDEAAARMNGTFVRKPDAYCDTYCDKGDTCDRTDCTQFSK